MVTKKICYTNVILLENGDIRRSLISAKMMKNIEY